MTFAPELKETMQQVLVNEKKMFENKMGGFIMRNMAKAWKKSLGITPAPNFSYQFLSGTEAIINISTGLDSYIKEEAILKSLKDYEKIAKGKLKIEVVNEKALEEHDKK